MKVSFRLVRFKEPQPYMTAYKKVRQLQAMTSCHVYDNEGEIVGAGLAKCAWGDRFERAIGRKIALTRAVAHLPRETRKEVWAQVLRRPEELGERGELHG